LIRRSNGNLEKKRLGSASAHRPVQLELAQWARVCGRARATRRACLLFYARDGHRGHELWRQQWTSKHFYYSTSFNGSNEEKLTKIPSLLRR
jgi:hypothetical protein